MAFFFLPWILATAAMASQAQVSSSKSRLQTVVAKKPVIKKERPYGASIVYSYSSDQNQQVDRKTSTHSLGLGAQYKLNSKLSTSVGTGLRWKAIGNNIENKESNPAWEDLDIGLSYSNRFHNDTKYSLSVTDSLPTGYESRTEGVRNTFTGSGSLSHSFFSDKLSVSGSAGATHILQTYDYSVTTGESNPDSVYQMSFAMGYRILEGLSLSAKYALSSFHMINGESNLARNQTSITASYSYWKVNGFLSYSVGNYDKSDGYRLLYVDDMRQMVTVGVGFEI